MTDESGQLIGPFAIMLIAPRIGQAVESLGTALRIQSSLSPRIRELAILTVASRLHSDFEWFAHEPAARDAGITAAQLTELRSQEIPCGLDEGEKTAVEAINLILEARSLDAASYERAEALLGEQGIAELVWLCGYYSMLAVALDVFPTSISQASPIQTRTGACSAETASKLAPASKAPGS